MEEYDIFAIALFARLDHQNRRNYRVTVHKADTEVSELNTLVHKLSTGHDGALLESERVYLGRFKTDDNISVMFRNDDDSESELSDDITLPVSCLFGNKNVPELALTGEDVQLKIKFPFELHHKPQTTNIETDRPKRFLPSMSAYRTLRSCVMAIARVQSIVANSTQGLVGVVTYVVEGTRFVITVGYDLTEDFLVKLDLLFSEGCQYLDQQMESTRTALMESLIHLNKELQLRLLTADHIITQKIVAILRRLHPYITTLARTAYPYVSLALFLTKPLRHVLYPYVEPAVHRALSVHDRLQRNFFIGPMVTSATEKVVAVIDTTTTMYEAIELENKHKWD